MLLLLLACAPPAPLVALGPQTPSTLDSLTATVDAETGYRVQWYRDKEPVEVDGLVVSSDRTARGEEWGLSVVPVHRDREGEAGTASVVIGNSAPTATVTVEGGHAESPLSALATGDDADGDTVTLGYAWFRDGELTELATADVLSTYTANDEVWEVEVTPNDGGVDGEPVRASVTIGNAPPTIESLQILPKPATSNDALWAEVDAQDVDGDTIDLLWAWYVDDELASESATLDPVARDRVVRLELTPFDGEQLGEMVEAGPVTILNGAPADPVAAIVSESTHAGWDAECIAVEPLVDPDGDTLETEVDWFIEGTLVDDVSQAVEGEQLSCVLKVNDGHGAQVDDRVDTTVLWACGLELASSISGPGADIAQGDVDADGVVDLVADDRVYWGPDFNTFSELGFGEHSGRLGIGDLDGDGVPEVVGSRAADGELDILWGDGTVEVVTQGDVATDVAVADVNGDGLADIVMQCVSGAAYRPVVNGSVVGQTALNGRVGALRVVEGRVAQLVDGTVWVDDVAVAEGVLRFDAFAEDLYVDSEEYGLVLLEADGQGGFDACPVLDESDWVLAGDFDGNGTPDVISVSDGWTMGFTE
jgi:hypothetical protein